MQNRVTNNVLIGIEKDAGLMQWGEKAFNTIKGWSTKAMKSGTGQKLKQWGTQATGFAAKHPVGTAVGAGAGAMAVGAGIGHHFGTKQPSAPKVTVNNNFNKKQAEYIGENDMYTVTDVVLSKIAEADRETQIQRQVGTFGTLGTIVGAATGAALALKKTKGVKSALLGAGLGAAAGAGAGSLLGLGAFPVQEKYMEALKSDKKWIGKYKNEKTAGSSDVTSALIVAKALTAPKIAPTIKDLPIPPEEYMRRQGKINTAVGGIAGGILGAVGGAGLGQSLKHNKTGLVTGAILGALAGTGLGAAIGHYGSKLQQYQYGYTDRDIAERKKKVADDIVTLTYKPKPAQIPVPKKTYDKIMAREYAPVKSGLLGGALGGTLGAIGGQRLGAALKHSHIGTGVGAVLGATLGALAMQNIDKAGVDSKKDFYLRG